MLAGGARPATSGISVAGSVICFRYFVEGRLQFPVHASVAYVKYLDHIAADEVQYTLITDNQMSYALLDIRILRCQLAAFNQQVDPLDSPDNLQIPIQRILWRLFGYLTVSPFKIVFRCRLDFNMVFLLQWVMSCLDSNPSVNSRSGRPSSTMACLMFLRLSAYSASAAIFS